VALLLGYARASKARMIKASVIAEKAVVKKCSELKTRESSLGVYFAESYLEAIPLRRFMASESMYEFERSA
jgi:hypothetical protein